jgi:hypothetical protein
MFVKNIVIYYSIKRYVHESMRSHYSHHCPEFYSIMLSHLDYRRMDDIKWIIMQY